MFRDCLICRVVAVFLLSVFFNFPAAAGEPENVAIPAGADVRLSALIFRPVADAPGRHTAVVLLHGGGWRWGEAAWMSERGRRLAAEGFPSVSLEYRLSKNGVTPIDAVQDACAAIAWLRSNAEIFRANIRHVAAYGMSAGGHLAAATVTAGCRDAGSAGRADVLLLWSPALAVEKDGWFQRLLGDAGNATDWSPNTNLNNRLPPTAIVHGDKDTLTPLAGSEVFCEGVRKAGSACELFVYPGVGHLLTRNLDNQESDFDVDPAMLEDGVARLTDFLIRYDSRDGLR